MAFGVTPNGFVRKPLPTILDELQQHMIDVFGPNVVQTSQSPLGQLNGMMADVIAEHWEIAEQVYQSYDPNQAEGIRLDELGALRNIFRRPNETDQSIRARITNLHSLRIFYHEAVNVLESLEQIRFVSIYVNSGTVNDRFGFPPNAVAIGIFPNEGANVSTIGELDNIFQRFYIPGIDYRGINHTFSSQLRYQARYNVLSQVTSIDYISIRVIRHEGFGVDDNTIVQFLRAEWEREYLAGGNSLHVYPIRKIIESNFDNIEVLSIAIKLFSQSNTMSRFDAAIAKVIDLTRPQIDIRITA